MTDYRPPHCNAQVLHAPGECVYCDREPVAQQARIDSGTPFTPNEANGWSGNVAAPAGKPHTHMGTTSVPDDYLMASASWPVFVPPSRRARLLAWLTRE